MTGDPTPNPAENWSDLMLPPASNTPPQTNPILALATGQRPPETPPPVPQNPTPPKPGTTTAARTDGQAAAAVAGSGGNSLGGFNASHGNLEQLRAEIARLTPILDTPDGQQQLMKALQDYLNAGGGQLQATDAGAQQQAGDIQGLLAGLQGGDKKPGKHSSKDGDDDDDDDHRHHGKDDDAASSFKDMLSSLPQALQGLNPFGANSPFGQSSPFGGANSPFGQSSPFGASSPFGPNSTPAGGAITPAANPFGTTPGAGGAAGGLTGAATPAGVTGSPFDQLRTDPATGEHKDDSLSVSLPNGETIQAATPELAKAIKESIANGDATAAYRAAGINIDQNPGELVDPDQVKPGYYARFDDGHIETAAGPGKIFSNGQIVDISSATDAADGFQGWYAPPGATPAATSQPKPTTTLTASK
ncbi:hypothetical protein PJN16_10395 [Mycobacterium kansasii]